MPIKVTILGATGSIGRSALEVIRFHRELFDIVGLTAGSNVEKLAAVAQEFRPAVVGIGDESGKPALEGLLPGARILTGAEGIAEIAAAPADVVLSGIVGAAGLTAALAAIEAGNTIALANKEPLVMAGQYIMSRARSRGVRVLPVDSEHNAVFQCLDGREPSDVHRVYLTASGGPFYGASREETSNVTPAEATRHPTWDMGAKISVDSATLMNKGLEVIEAHWLFALPYDAIEVVIHPQSIVHALVELTDGGYIAHLGPTDMILPIQFALTWPKRVKSSVSRLDLTEIQALTFAKPDFRRFPCLRLALEAGLAGGIAPAVLSAANEVAVDAFCSNRITFNTIAGVVEEALSRMENRSNPELEEILAADRTSRDVAVQYIDRLGARTA